MSELTKWPEANVDTTEIAADMAWGAFKSWHVARDLNANVTAGDVREIADQVGVQWAGREGDDLATDVAREVLARLGFEVISGSLDGDAVLKKK